MQPQKLIDYHLHSARTIDCKMTEPQVCEQALAMNIQEIAFTNHVMLTQPDYKITAENFVEHWKQIQICQLRYPQLIIRLGIEMDYYEGREGDIKAVLHEYETIVDRPFDIVLGSVHTMLGVFFSEKHHAPELYKDHDIVTLYHEYFALASKAARSRLFDVMAHPDLIKKYTGELAPQLAFEKYSSAADSFVDALVESGIGLEVNTKGYNLKIGQAYPSDELLALYINKTKAKGATPIITLGSDAHNVASVGQHLADGIQAIHRANHDTIMRFQSRKPIAFQI